MSTFYKNYVSLCAKNKKSLSRAAEEAGFSRTAPNGWKKGKIPSDTTIERIAQYFGVSSEYLKDAEIKEPPSPNKGSEDDSYLKLKLTEFIENSTVEERLQLIIEAEKIKSRRSE